MRRAFVLVGICLCLSSAAAGLTDYVVSLDREVDEQEYEELEVGGSYDIDFEDQELTIELSFRVNLTNQSFRSTDISDFQVTMMAPGSEPVSSMRLNGMTVQQGERVYVPWKTMKTETAVMELDYLLFQVNHTPTDTDGNNRGRRQVTGRIPTPRVLIDQQVETFGTNASEVMRGDDIYVNGSVDDIGRLHLSWNTSSQSHELTLQDNAFGQWVPLPEGLDTGGRVLPLTLVTGRGEVFPRTVRLTVRNRPPDVSLKHQDTIPNGTVLDLTVDAEDDIGVTNISVRFRGKTFTPDDGAVSLPTDDLPEGIYDFTVVVTDTAGAQVTADGSVTIEEQTNEQRDDNGGEETDTKGDQSGGEGDLSKNESFLISVVNGIRGFFEDLLFG